MRGRERKFVSQTETKVKIILLVEDEPGIAKVCLRTLTGAGFQVDVAVNGEVALDMWGKKHYDLCISDIMTPGMNGIELFRRLEKEYHDAGKKFIFTTGNLLSNEIRSFLEDSGRPYLPKPFSPENLREIVNNFLAES